MSQILVCFVVQYFLEDVITLFGFWSKSAKPCYSSFNHKENWPFRKLNSSQVRKPRPCFRKGDMISDHGWSPYSTSGIPGLPRKIRCSGYLNGTLKWSCFLCLLPGLAGDVSLTKFVTLKGDGRWEKRNLNREFNHFQLHSPWIKPFWGDPTFGEHLAHGLDMYCFSPSCIWFYMYIYIYNDISWLASQCLSCTCLSSREWIYMYIYI